MKDQQSSYRQIIKATSIFGGVEVFKIIIKIIQSKIMAVLLGPAGIGIYTLLFSTTRTLQTMTSFGLKTSGVKSISEAFAMGDQSSLLVVTTVIRKLVWVTGVIGTLLCVLLAHNLSELSFGNTDYTYGFIWLGLTLLFNQVCSGNLAILQGLRKLKYLANANLSGAIFGLLFSIPLYYFFGVNGIIPAMIAVATANMLRTYYFIGKLELKQVTVSWPEAFRQGREMLRLGSVLSLSSLVTVGVAYLVRVYVGKTGGVEQVGLFGAGFVIVNTYVGLVFSAMGTDYYPRLCAATKDGILKVNKTINHQAEITVLILSPVIILFIVYVNYIITMLYSSSFVEVNDMIKWASFGTFFKALSWAISFIFLAKGLSRDFLLNELTANIYLLVFNVAGYKYGGLEGLGVSFLVGYFCYFLQVFTYARFKHGFLLSSGITYVAIIQLILISINLSLALLVKGNVVPFIGSFIFCLSVYFSYSELNKRIDIKSLLFEKIRARASK